MALQFLVFLYVAVVGLMVGSYLNVVIHRLPRGKSTVLPRSRCPHCNGVIAALDNLPVVSFLLLRGRCRSCRGPIPWRYPIVEAATALLFLAALHRFGLTGRAVAVVGFGCILIALAGIDFEHYILPDVLTLPTLAAGILISFWADWISPLEAALGALIGGGVLWLVAKAWWLLRGEEGLGLGDVKMLAMAGAFLGWQGVAVTLFLGSLAGSVVGVALIARGRMGLKGKLPFGVYLSAGAMVALFFGPQLVASYSRLL
jgi:leader peptidase (prepilin peptidase) / N-methyltransferase